MTDNHHNKARLNFITAKSTFTISILVCAITILSIWLLGLGKHRTIFENSLMSTSLLSLAFFLFLTINLYRGFRLKDDLGSITNRIKKTNFPDLSSGLDFSADSLDFDGDGLGAIILGIITWIAFSFVLLLVIWFFGALLWTSILVFAAMLYWIFFRALRLVFKNSNKCKNDLSASIGYGISYTLLYNFWIYGIIFISHSL